MTKKLTDKITKIKEENNTNLTNYICMSKIEGFESVEELIKQGEDLLEKGNTEYIDAKIDEKYNEYTTIYIRNYIKIKSSYAFTKKYCIKYICNAMCRRY